MARRPFSDPRSPVQQGGSRGLVPALVVAALLALLFWGLQQNRSIAEPPPPPPREVAPPGSPNTIAGEPARARANLAAYFTDNDYPADAIRRDEQGTVGFVLDVAPEGRIARCLVEQSSGSAALDAATCRTLRSRARFRPARDAAGRPVGDRVRGRIKWVLPPV